MNPYRSLSPAALLVLTLWLSGATALGATKSFLQPELNSSKIAKKIKKGDFEAGGSVNLYSSSQGFFAQWNANLEYFLRDNFSLGGTLAGGHSDFGTSLLFGPSATYYFWEGEKVATYVRQSITYSDQTFDIFSMTAIGAKYFIIPSVAIGTQLSYTVPLTGNPDSRALTTATSTLSFHF